MRTSKRPQARSVGASASAAAMATSAASGKWVSACRKSRHGPRACAAPAFICRARPRGAVIIASPRWPASAVVASLLPPSTTMTSTPRARSGASASSMTATLLASSSTGTTMLRRMGPNSGAEAGMDWDAMTAASRSGRCGPYSRGVALLPSSALFCLRTAASLRARRWPDT